MKKNRSFLWRMVVLTTLCLSTLLVFTGCGKEDDGADHNQANYTISGNASGAQMMPAVSGSGSGTITGTYNPNTRELIYTTNWTNLSGAPISGGFYTGASGAAGTAVGTPWTLASGLTGTGTHAGTMTLTSEQANQLTGGNWYYMLGTAANSGGEIRGQISATR